ncbi:MAG TPA: hypothetical protein VG076_00215 [Acidimicrobiales bacterium]|jgi:hypothetical protein|nr:hypothetical protein [Acidimicrobiales bacterium]
MAFTPDRSRRRWLRRSGPAVVLSVAVVAAAVIAVVNRGGGTTTATIGTTGSTIPAAASPAGAGAGALRPAGVLSWSQAKAEGKTASIDWGPRCDTTIGKLKYPSYFAGECYAPFTGDNGGSTYQGVTATSIKVVFYLPEDHDPVLSFAYGAIGTSDTNAQTAQTMQDFVTFFETYYETYGRKVDLVPYTATGTILDEVAARADAVQIAESIKPFAVVGGPMLTNAFADELAARKILCLDCTPGQTDAWYAARAPYVWGVTIGPEQAQQVLAEYIGKRLAGRVADNTDDPNLRSRKRSFGLVYLTSGPESEQVEKEFEDNLARYKVKPAAVLSYKSPLDLLNDAPSLIAKLKDSGVTSVVFTGDPLAPGALAGAAANQQWFPEWVVTGSGYTDTNVFGRTYDPREWRHAFGISFLPARTDPSVSGAKFLHQWFFGRPTPAPTGAQLTVGDFTLLFSVLQGMGPTVTPQVFGQALFAAPATARAITQPSVSFGNKGLWPNPDYLGIDDATEVWWNPVATGPDELQRQGRGMYEFVAGGKRYLPGQWPATASEVFNPAGAVSLYTTVPKAEEVPNYPSPAGH